MTIEEAIKKYRKLSNSDRTCYPEEAAQIAEWLEELKAYKEKEFDVLKQDGQLLYKQGVIDGYNKAIDDFAETIKTSQEAHLWYCSDYGLEFCNGDNCEECSHEFTKQIDKIAEKLKKVE